ncbi:MAG: hypothetical protein OES26_25625, partial [Gammaproteobacteria bacterium]|nr:hypothetical protein [Gammaproteobacteria bacterium]
VQNLRAAIPEARIIIVLRRQDALARSLYRQYLKRGGTAKVGRFYGEDKKHPALMSRNRFRYSTYLDLLKGSFPMGLKVLLFEDFITNQSEFIRELCEFVGVESPAIDLKIENATKLGPIGTEMSRWANYFFRSMLNRGPLPAMPMKRFGRWQLVSPVEYFHDFWPGSGRPSKGIAKVCSQILSQVADDNRLVASRYGLDLEKHRYF